MSMTPDAPNTTVRPNHSSLITQPVLAVVVMLLVAVACSSKIHLTCARRKGALGATSCLQGFRLNLARTNYSSASICLRRSVDAPFTGRRDPSRLTHFALRWAFSGQGQQCHVVVGSQFCDQFGQLRDQAGGRHPGPLGQK